MKNKKIKSCLQLLTGLFLIIFVSTSCQKEEGSNFSKPIVSQSTDVSIDQAGKIALNLSKNKLFNEAIGDNENGLKSGKIIGITPVNKEIDKVLVINDGTNTPALYVVKYFPKGFVILSATKKERPILAFSEENFDENYAEIGLSDWIAVRKKTIENLKKDLNYKVPKDVQEEWLSSAPPEDEEIIISGGTVYEQYGPFLSTTWGQWERYNDKLSSLGCLNTTNNRPPTGCVATAIAQLTRYWSYPSSYNWSIMPSYVNKYSDITSGTLEMAKIMKDAGASIT